MEWKTMDFKDGKTRLGLKIGEILEGNNFGCSLCSGKGILPRTKGIKCPVCRDEGMVSLTGPIVVCAYCKGRGVVLIFPQRLRMSLQKQKRQG